MSTNDIVDKEVERVRKSGLYTIASLDMFNQIEKIVIEENLQLHLEYTNELLKEYLSEILELEGSKPGLIEFLKAIKD